MTEEDARLPAYSLDSQAAVGALKPVPPFPQRDALPVYAIAYALLRSYYGVATRLRVEGRDYVPLQGGVVVACNHTRGNDYFALGMASPRQIYFMGKAEAFETYRIVGALLRAGGSISVARGAGDLEALAQAVKVVRDGHLLGMFPEGHRSPDGRLQRGKTGATRIALEAGAPVLPAVVIGAEAGFKNFPRFWDRKLLLVRFGAPFYLEGTASDRASVVNGTKRIMRSIAALLPEEMRGEYASDVDTQRRGRTTRTS